jgi:hypothetical protein
MARLKVSFSPMANWENPFVQIVIQVVDWVCQLSLIEQLSSKLLTSVIHCHLNCWECHFVESITLSDCHPLSPRLLGVSLVESITLSDCHPLFIQVVVGSVTC